MKISDLISFFETWAPLQTQDTWDNSGLLVGDSEDLIHSALLCLDCTEDVIEEAYNTGCNLVICHHPPIFKPLKRFVSSDLEARVIIKAIQFKIGILALHTNLDHAPEGVSYELGKRLNLQQIQVLQPLKKKLLKFQTYCPIAHSNQVRQALFKAGAGEIQGYSECSFNTQGMGTFKPGEFSKPFVGQQNQYHEEEEIKIECIFPVWKEKQIIQALHESHPYEVPAFDIIPLENNLETFGAGITGYLEEPMNANDFLAFLSKNLSAPMIRYTHSRHEYIHKVACCGGSGSFLLGHAINKNAEALVTADFKYHQFFEADKKTMVADIGHYESEQFTPALIHRKLSEKFPNFALRLSNLNTNPIQYYYHGYNG